MTIDDKLMLALAMQMLALFALFIIIIRK